MIRTAKHAEMIAMEIAWNLNSPAYVGVCKSLYIGPSDNSPVSLKNSMQIEITKYGQTKAAIVPAKKFTSHLINHISAKPNMELNGKMTPIQRRSQFDL